MDVGSKDSNAHSPWKLPCKSQVQRLLRNYPAWGWRSQLRLGGSPHCSLSLLDHHSHRRHTVKATVHICLGRGLSPYSTCACSQPHSAPRVSKPRCGPTSGLSTSTPPKTPEASFQSSWTHFYGSDDRRSLLPRCKVRLPPSPTRNTGMSGCAQIFVS